MDRTCRTCAYMTEKTKKNFFGTDTEMYCMRIGVTGVPCRFARADKGPYSQQGACGEAGVLWESKQEVSK